MSKPQIAIVGGGAAGFFLALNMKERSPRTEVTILERSHHLLAKVAVSGGGRCNCTNTFSGISDLQTVYPRGHRLMKRLMNDFSCQDAYRWFESHGVPLMVQEDHCVFPAAQDAHAIIDCFLRLAHTYGIHIQTGHRVTSLDELSDYDAVAITTGGSPRGEGLQWLAAAGHEVVPPVPSLFSLTIADPQLTALMGLVIPDVALQLTSTKLRATGPLLITHWGFSGPAMLKLSSYGARLLADVSYQHPLAVNWLQQHESTILQTIDEAIVRDSHKQLTTYCPFSLPQRLWVYLLRKSLGDRAQIRWSEMNKKDKNRLVNTLTNDVYMTTSRAPFKDEFVTCGGISLSSIHPATMESRLVENLYFAGEVLDIDGITGGFNFQAAWTTAYVAARSIVSKLLV